MMIHFVIFFLYITGTFGQFIPFDQSLPCMIEPVAVAKAGMPLFFQYRNPPFVRARS